jgi:hypothetical protein
MKISSKNLMRSVLAVAALILIFAFLTATHILNLEIKQADEISTYMMIVGVALFVWARKVRKEEEAELAEKKEEEEKAANAVAVNEPGNVAETRSDEEKADDQATK